MLVVPMKRGIFLDLASIVIHFGMELDTLQQGTDIRHSSYALFYFFFPLLQFIISDKIESKFAHPWVYSTSCSNNPQTRSRGGLLR